MGKDINPKYLPPLWQAEFDGFEWIVDSGEGPCAHESDDPMSILLDHLATLE